MEHRLRLMKRLFTRQLWDVGVGFLCLELGIHFSVSDTAFTLTDRIMFVCCNMKIVINRKTCIWSMHVAISSKGIWEMSDLLSVRWPWQTDAKYWRYPDNSQSTVYQQHISFISSFVCFQKDLGGQAAAAANNHFMFLTPKLHNRYNFGGKIKTPVLKYLMGTQRLAL